MRNLTIPGKFTLFKTLALSEIIHITLVTVIPNGKKDLKRIYLVFQFLKLRTVFCLRAGSLKNADISSKKNSF